jgi:hypothetical protein
MKEKRIKIYGKPINKLVEDKMILRYINLYGHKLTTQNAIRRRHTNSQLFQKEYIKSSYSIIVSRSWR